MNKRLLLIGGNFHPEPIGIGKYNGEMIDFLAKQGYQCSVITSYPYYPDWKIQEPYSKYCYWYKRELKDTGYGKSSAIEIFRCPQYVPSKPTGKRRILLDISFCITASIKVTQLLFQKKYDVVIAVAPCFQVGLIAILYKKFKGAKFLYHIQDLQIDAARELKMIRSQMMINILLKIEKYILKKADTVSSISPAMIKKIKQKFERDIVFFPNWVNTSLFYPLQEKDKLKEEFSFNASDKIVLYSGAIGEKQGLEAIIDAAEGLGYISELKFIICGMGPYKEKLEQLKEKRNLKNLVFLPLQPTEKLNRFLNMADIHLVLQKATVGDLVMPSKLTTILSVGGLAIIAANETSNLYEVISKYELGVIIEPENSPALINAIKNMLADGQTKISLNARNYAEELLSIEHIFQLYAVNMQ